MAADALIDLPTFIRAQRRERYPSFVVHGPPLSGKSRFAQALAHKLGLGYLDVLGVLAEQPELAAQIDRFDVAALKRLILDRAAGVTEALLIDDLDFLFPVWADDLMPFKEMVRGLICPGQPMAFGFFVQTRREWQDWNLLTAARASRILQWENIQPV
jgi:hypothetical protein